MKRRNIECYNMDTKSIEDSNQCIDKTRPHDIEPCEKRSCAVWKTSSWSTCSATCGQVKKEIRVLRNYCFVVFHPVGRVFGNFSLIFWIGSRNQIWIFYGIHKGCASSETKNVLILLENHRNFHRKSSSIGLFFQPWADLYFLFR